MIRFTFKPDDKNNDTRPDRICIKASDDISLPDLMEHFKSFCLALGYSTETVKKCFEFEPAEGDG